MPAVAALLESRTALLTLRRTLPRGGPSVATCRALPGLYRLLESRLVDTVVLAPSTALLPEIADLRTRFPGLPLVVFAPFRPDDGELLLTCERLRVASAAVEGVDDAVLGDLVLRHSLTTARRAALADAPRVLRLTEPLQRRAWEVLVTEVERPVLTSTLARRLEVSREHLSRQFGAGGAPNLKRVIDLTRVACAAQLLQNPGYAVATVVRLLHFASASHLSATARRIAGTSTVGLRELGVRGVLGKFVRGNMRSRQ